MKLNKVYCYLLPAGKQNSECPESKRTGRADRPEEQTSRWTWGHAELSPSCRDLQENTDKECDARRVRLLVPCALFVLPALTWPLHPGVPELGQIPRVLLLLRLRFFCCRNNGAVRRRFEFGLIFARVVCVCVSKDMRLKRDTRKEVRHCVDVDLYGARTEFRRRRGGMSLRRRGHCL